MNFSKPQESFACEMNRPAILATADGDPICEAHFESDGNTFSLYCHKDFVDRKRFFLFEKAPLPTIKSVGYFTISQLQQALEWKTKTAISHAKYGFGVAVVCVVMYSWDRFGDAPLMYLGLSVVFALAIAAAFAAVGYVRGASKGRKVAQSQCQYEMSWKEPEDEKEGTLIFRTPEARRDSVLAVFSRLGVETKEIDPGAK